jgi:hypothetical protein
MLRTTLIELAWMWLRYQPSSALSTWFRERVGNGKGRCAALPSWRSPVSSWWRYGAISRLVWSRLALCSRHADEALAGGVEQEFKTGGMNANSKVDGDRSAAWLRYASSIDGSHPLWSPCDGTRTDAQIRQASCRCRPIAVSFHRLFLGGLLPSRARFRFAGYLHGIRGVSHPPSLSSQHQAHEHPLPNQVLNNKSQVILATQDLGVSLALKSRSKCE